MEESDRASRLGFLRMLTFILLGIAIGGSGNHHAPGSVRQSTNPVEHEVMLGEAAGFQCEPTELDVRHDKIGRGFHIARVKATC